MTESQAPGKRPPGYSRVVVKIGTATLTGGASELDASRVRSLTSQLVQLRERGVKLVIVSSGAIAAGIGPLKLTRRPSDMPTLQAAAAVGQRRLMDLYADLLEPEGVPVAQVLLTQYDMVQRSHYVNARNTMERLLDLGSIPIVNENDTVAVEEIRYGDNDRLAALVANIVRADLLVMLSDVEGLYTTDPRVRGRKTAELVSVVDEITPDLMKKASARRSAYGSGGMGSKLEAARIATLSGVAVVIASGERPGVLIDICAGEEVGTYFPPRRSRLSARKLWLEFAPTARGKIVVDAGAVKALSNGDKSLLAAGVTGVEGSFRAGDAVEVVGPEGAPVAKGLVGYDSEIVTQLAGTKNREVIHKDQLVLL